MSYKELKDLPVNKGDPVILPNDSGPAIQAIQNILQQLPEEKQRQDFLGSMGKGYTLIDGNHSGKFDIETGRALLDYQNKYKSQIMAIGGLTEQDFEKEKNKVGYATWAVMSQSVSTVQEEKPSVSPPPPSAPVTKLPDPVNASSVKKATHYVKTRNPNHRLALRKAPSMVKVSKEASQDTDKKGDLVIMMPNETLLNIIEPFIGYHCEWDQVEIVDNNPSFDTVKTIQKDNPLFCYAEFVQPLQNTAPMLAVNCLDCTEPGGAAQRIKELLSMSDWTNGYGLCDPWYDDAVCSYLIVVPTLYESSDDSLIVQQKNEALKIGINALLTFYDKQRSENDIEQKYLKAYRFAEIVEWYIDERPGSKLKFLIRIPAKYFDAIPSNTDFLKDIPNADNGTLPKGWKTAHFLSSNIKKNIEAVAKIIESYEGEFQQWGGELPDYSFKEEANRLRSFLPVFVDFLNWNGYDLVEENEDSYEFGFGGDCFKIEYVLISQAGLSSPLRIGFDCFRKKEPVIFDRTMGYFAYSSDIISDAKKEKKTWSDFIFSYTCPLVEIKPSKSVTPRKIDEVPPAAILPYGPIKTKRQKKAEDVIVSDPSLKEKLAFIRSKVYHYVGDSMFSCDNIPRLLDRITTLDDLYDKVLNKVGIHDLTSFVVSCLAAKFLPPDFWKLACKLVLKQLGFNELQKVLSFLESGLLSKIQEKVAYFQYSEVGSAALHDADKLRKAMQLVASEDQLCKAITSFDPDLIAAKIKFLTSFKLPGLIRKYSIPTVGLSDGRHTEDIMAEIASLIMEAIKQVLAIFLIELIKGIFKSICAQCKPNVDLNRKENYGDTKIKDVLDHSRGFSPQRMTEDFGIKEDLSDDMNKFFDDLSNMLLPSELCELLNGVPSDDVLNAALVLLGTKYFNLFKYFSTPAKIKDLFSYIGRFFDADVCLVVDSMLVAGEVTSSDLCEQPELEMRRSLLQKKLSPKQVDDQIDALKKRNAAKLEQIADLLDGNLLSNILPNISSDGCNNGQKSIIPYDPPSVKYLNNQVVDFMYDNVNMLFNLDISGFVPVLSVDHSVNKSDFSSDKDIKDAMLANRISPEEFEGKGLNSIYKTKYGDDPKRTMDLARYQEILSKDPLGLGENRGDKSEVFILPEIKTAIGNVDNIQIQNGDFLLKTVNLSNLPEKAVKIYKEGIKKIESEGTVAAGSLHTNLILQNNVFSPMSGMKLSIGQKEEENCLEQFDSRKPVGIFKNHETDIIAADTVVKYKMKNVIDNKVVDGFVLISNEPGDKEPLVVNEEQNIRDEYKKSIGNITSDSSIQREAFANYMVNAIKPILDKSSQEKINNNSLFYNYFRDVAYDDSYKYFLHTIMHIIGDSKLFNLRELEKIDFVEVMKSNAGCPPEKQDSLLNTESIKQFVNERYERIINGCEKIKSKKDLMPIEEANIGGVIEAFVRVCVIDYLLRGIFVFSQFKMSEILKGGLFSKYIVWKVEEEIKKFDVKFYEKVLQETKIYLLGKQTKFVDPFIEDLNDPNSYEDPIYKNELHPDYQSGKIFFEYFVKEQLKDVVEKIENLFKGGIINVATHIMGLSNRQDPSKVNSYYKVDFYVRVTTLNGKDVNKIEDVDTFFGNTKTTKISIGAGGSEAFQGGQSKCGVLGIYLNLNLGNSYIDTAQTQLISFNKNQYGTVTVPLIQIDSDILVENTEEGYKEYKQNESMNSVRLNNSLFNSDQFKFLFEFVFSMSRMVSLATIYNISMTSILVKDLDYLFENTKRYLRIMFETLSNTTGEWWTRESDEVSKVGGNQGLFKQHMDNITVDGPSFNLAAVAARAVPIIIKGMAARFDPCYKLVKKLDDAGLALMGPTWGTALTQVPPVNIIPPPPIAYGWGPPVGPLGILALSLDLLSGEFKASKQREEDKKSGDKGEVSCEEKEKK